MPAEPFPTRMRCTSMSLPYHIGNGGFGCPMAAAPDCSYTNEYKDAPHSRAGRFSL